MQNFQDNFETRKRSFISACSICMTVLLRVFSRIEIIKNVCYKNKTFGISFSILHRATYFNGIMSLKLPYPECFQIFQTVLTSSGLLIYMCIEFG